MILGPHTITRLRGTATTDEFNNPVVNWSSPSTLEIEGCSVQPATGDENIVGRETIVSRWQVWAPDGSDVVATDRVQYDGDTYEVDGEVQRWAFPPMSHIQFLLHRGDAL